LAARRVGEETGLNLKKAAWRGTAAEGDRRAVAAPAWGKAGAQHCPVGAVRRRAEVAGRSPALAPEAGAAMRPVEAEAMPPAAEGKQPVLAEVAQHLAVRAAVRKETAAAELEKKTEKVAADQRTATVEGWKKLTTCQ